MTGWPGAPYFSTMYFGGNTSGEAPVAAAAVRAYWDGIKGFITSGGVIQVQSDVEQVDPATGFITAVYSTTSVAVNSTGNAPLPKATQGLVRWRTGDFVSGKEIRGRTFIPALANDAQLVGVPSTTFKTTLTTAGNTLLTSASAAGNLVVWSRKNGQASQVSSFSVWDQFAVLRSRRD